MEERVPYSRFSATMLGTLLVTLGVVVLANPGDITVFLVRLVGIACIVFAAMTFAGHLYRAHAIDAVPYEELAGAGLLLFFGAVVAVFPDSLVETLFSVLGALIVLSGFGDIARSRRMPADDERKERLTLMIGIITVAAGLFVTFVPSAALRAVPIVCGIALILDGLSELYIALRISAPAEPKY